MSIVKIVTTVSRITVAGYRILATSILGYYLVKETIRREIRSGRKHTGDGRSHHTARDRKRSEEGDSEDPDPTAWFRWQVC